MNKIKRQKLQAGAVAAIFIAIISWWLSSSYFYSIETIPWASRNAKESKPEYVTSLTTAKSWATEYYKNDRGIIRFEYLILEQTKGFEVMVMPRYKGGTFTIDGDMCVLTNTKHKFVKAKQCMAPDDVPTPPYGTK